MVLPEERMQLRRHLGSPCSRSAFSEEVRPAALKLRKFGNRLSRKTKLQIQGSKGLRNSFERILNEVFVAHKHRFATGALYSPIVYVAAPTTIWSRTDNESSQHVRIGSIVESSAQG